MKRPFFGVPASEVFTPRRHAVNPSMYVHRPTLERQLLRAARGAKHFCVFGESGNGKSWLYKHVFESNRIDYTTLNLSKANVVGSVYKAIEEKVANSGDEQIHSRTTTKEGSFQPGGVGIGGSMSTEVRVSGDDPIKRLFRKIRGTKRFPSIVVFDNFEMILSNSDVVEELSNMIVMLDDDDYGDFNIRFCFVGVPSEIRDYLASQNNRNTIMTRLTEIDEVSRMKPVQAQELLRNGLETQLRLKFLEREKKELLYNRLVSVSDRIATEIQGLGLQVAWAAQENDGLIEDLVVDDAIEAWLSESHSSVKQTVLERLNLEGNGRRSQVLYCLGVCDTEDFTAPDIANIFLNEFGLSSAGTPVDVRRILNSLTKGKNPPLNKNNKTEGFRFSNPKYRMAIRGMLQRNGVEIYMPKRKL